MSKLINTKSLFKKALKEKFAVPAFNCNNLETIKAVLSGASLYNSPVILAFSPSAITYMGLPVISAVVKAEIKDLKIPVVLHLDHSPTFELCESCIDAGFTSVMIDASSMPLSENIKVTKKVVEYANKFDVSVEAEVGRLAGIEDHVDVSQKDSIYSDPKDVTEFIKQTKCDSLAIAIGTSHGAYKFAGDAHLRFDILKKITELNPDYPFVLHGASSVPSELVKECQKLGANLQNAKGVSENLIKESIKKGITKINIDTDLRLAFYKGVKGALIEKPNAISPRDYLSKGIDEIQKVVIDKIKLLNTENKA